MKIVLGIFTYVFLGLAIWRMVIGDTSTGLALSALSLINGHMAFDKHDEDKS